MPSHTTPAAVTRRPAQPIRPMPARKLTPDKLALQVRRRRYRKLLPPKAGERGW